MESISVALQLVRAHLASCSCTDMFFLFQSSADLALRCLVQFHLRSCNDRQPMQPPAIAHPEQEPKEVAPAAKRPDALGLGGILIALCCHHCCSWAHYTGRDVLGELGFTPTEFHLLCLMSSWAVCGVRPQTGSTRNKASGPDTSVEQVSAGPTSAACTVAASVSSHEEAVDHSRSSPAGYTPHPREEIGLKCKRLVDYGRLAYVQRECGLPAKLVHYVDRATSLENVLLMVPPC